MAKGTIIKRSDLIKVVEEANEKVRLNPPIEILEEDRMKDIKIKIKEWENEFYVNDPWSPLALTVFKEIELTLQNPPSEKKTEEKVIEKKEDDLDDLDNLSREELEKIISDEKLRIKVTKKMSDDGIREAIREQQRGEAEVEAIREQQRGEAEVKEKTEKNTGKKVTRPSCVAEVLRNMKKEQSISIQEWTKEADSQYVSNGESSNLKQTELLVNRALSFLIPLEIVSIDGKTITLCKTL